MEFKENYSLLKTSDRLFDHAYWAELGPEAIFDAAYDLIKDYYLLKSCNADQPRLCRTVESFQKA